jgi:hypothetical protein
MDELSGQIHGSPLSRSLDTTTPSLVAYCLSLGVNPVLLLPQSKALRSLKPVVFGPGVVWFHILVVPSVC